MKTLLERHWCDDECWRSHVYDKKYSDLEDRFQKAWSEVKGFCNALEDLDGQTAFRFFLHQEIANAVSNERQRIIKMLSDL